MDSGSLTSQFSVKPIDHLGLVAGLLKRYKIAERIDNQLPIADDERTNTTYGQRVVAMILNGLGFCNSPLYMTPEFFRHKPIDRLIGEGMVAEDFNDHALGRALDKLHRAGTTKVFCQLAFELVQEQGLLCRDNHLDTTSLALFGQYDHDVWKNAPKPTYGHSKDHRPDLKQVVVSLITNGPAGAPLWYECLDGNSSDKTSFHETIKQVNSFQRSIENSEDFLWVADSALYTQKKLQQSGVLWLTRVPATYRAVKHFLAQPQSSVDWQELTKGYQAAWVDGAENERWLLVSSDAGKARALNTLTRAIKKEHEVQCQALKALGREQFTCKKDAFKAITTLEKKLKYHQLSEQKLKAVMGCDKPGRPKDGEKKVLGYRIKGELKQNNAAIEKAKIPCGRFILATNDPRLISAKKMLDTYKEQAQVEDGFRFIKDKSFHCNQIFLQNPQRIDALMMVMTLALLVYKLGQYQFRERLKEKEAVVPSQLGKPTQKPTLRWVFQMLQGISCVYISGKYEGVVNIGEREANIIRLMGKDVMAIYSME